MVIGNRAGNGVLGLFVFVSRGHVCGVTTKVHIGVVFASHRPLCRFFSCISGLSVPSSGFVAGYKGGSVVPCSGYGAGCVTDYADSDGVGTMTSGASYGGEGLPVVPFRGCRLLRSIVAITILGRVTGACCQATTAVYGVRS